MVSESLGKSVPDTNSPPSYEKRQESIPVKAMPTSGTEAAFDSDLPFQHASDCSSTVDARSKPIVVELHRGEPEQVLSLGRIRLGASTIIIRDILLLPPTISFAEFWDLIIERMRQRSLIPPYSAHDKVYGFLSLKPDKKWSTPSISLDRLSWQAGREMLLTREDAVLTCKMAVASAAYETAKTFEVEKETSDKAASTGKRKKPVGCSIQ